MHEELCIWLGYSETLSRNILVKAIYPGNHGTYFQLFVQRLMLMNI